MVRIHLLGGTRGGLYVDTPRLSLFDTPSQEGKGYIAYRHCEEWSDDAISRPAIIY